MLKKLTSNQELKIAYWFLAVSYVLMNLWAALSPGTWDDDCQGRFYSVQDVFSNPGVLVDLWVRPLWALLFFIPAQLGPWVIPVIMSLISLSAALALVKAAQIQGFRFVYLLVPFLIFQPYFWGVGRDAMTEPLAAALSAWSFLFLLRKQWLWFAIFGSLLPLARLELSILLLFWLIPLIQDKQWKYIPVLGVALVLLNIAGAILTKSYDWLWLYHQTVGGEVKDNPYGHQQFHTYFSRYLYVVGPVVFFFLFNGLIFRILDRKTSLFIDGQFIAGLLLYSVFAWKLDVGASAGFLRNLIPLSPFSAYIALAGFNYFVAWLNKKLPIKPMFFWATMLSAPVLTALFYSKQIELHHRVTEAFDFWNLPLSLVCLILLFIFSFIVKKQNSDRLTLALSFIFSALIIIHTLITEPPDANMSSERYAVSHTGDLLKKYGLDKQKIHTGHYWLYWSLGFRKNDPRFVGNLRKINLDSAQVGEIFVWEHHYTERFGNDLSQIALSTDNTLVELLTVFADDGTFEVKVYQKVNPNDGINVLNNFITQHPDCLEALFSRAVYASQTGQYAGAVQDYNTILAKRKTGYIYCSLANMYLATNDLTQALSFYNHALTYGDYKGQIHFYRAHVYHAQNNDGAACADLLVADKEGILQASQKYKDWCVSNK